MSDGRVQTCQEDLFGRRAKLKASSGGPWAVGSRLDGIEDGRGLHPSAPHLKESKETPVKTLTVTRYGCHLCLFLCIKI